MLQNLGKKKPSYRKNKKTVKKRLKKHNQKFRRHEIEWNSDVFIITLKPAGLIHLLCILDYK